MNLTVIENKIFNLLDPVANAIGYGIVNVKFTGSTRKILEISIDRLDEENVTIKDCQNASNNFSATLDVEEAIAERYYLEVSSAGIERPLVRLQDFERFKGKIAQIRTRNLIEDVKKFEAELAGISEDKVLVKLASSNIIALELEEIKSAKLVFTEAMFRDSLSKEKNKENPAEDANDK
ncbi:MAG: ribosome maturation factor RimP [Rickettsiaceae bacterium]|nr:ribosome maturation factor RimP [Rickettsiaceae bacterium]